MNVLSRSLGMVRKPCSLHSYLYACAPVARGHLALAQVVFWCWSTPRSCWCREISGCCTPFAASPSAPPRPQRAAAAPREPWRLRALSGGARVDSSRSSAVYRCRRRPSAAFAVLRFLGLANSAFSRATGSLLRTLVARCKARVDCAVTQFGAPHAIRRSTPRTAPERGTAGRAKDGEGEKTARRSGSPASASSSQHITRTLQRPQLQQRPPPRRYRVEAAPLSSPLQSE